MAKVTILITTAYVGGGRDAPQARRTRFGMATSRRCSDIKTKEHGMKIILWIIAIIFIVGLLTITGVFKMLF
ncbi:hypothetical protein [Nissabacter sp. SGAir0207]|uniref:hypothetical protein n=1 Tax=Nissabacter sp. SGAir0207 TaxID=2126321 RepID=UPI0010F6A0FA|nr:hypothetical protein [Nissabacter sp. SGAir0207]